MGARRYQESRRSSNVCEKRTFNDSSRKHYKRISDMSDCNHRWKDSPSDAGEEEFVDYVNHKELLAVLEKNDG